MVQTHPQVMMLKERKKPLEVRLRSKNREEFWEALEEAKRDPEFVKELKRITKELGGVDSLHHS